MVNSIQRTGCPAPAPPAGQLTDLALAGSVTRKREDLCVQHAEVDKICAEQTRSRECTVSTCLIAWWDTLQAYHPEVPVQGGGAPMRHDPCGTNAARSVLRTARPPAPNFCHTFPRCSRSESISTFDRLADVGKAAEVQSKNFGGRRRRCRAEGRRAT